MSEINASEAVLGAEDWSPRTYDLQHPDGNTVTGLGLVSCAPGNYGSARAACPDHLGAFLPLAGCAENVCDGTFGNDSAVLIFNDTHNDTTGYVVPNVNSTSVTDLGPLSCAFGYHGLAAITCPEHNGTFPELAGCSENVCDRFSDTFPQAPDRFNRAGHPVGYTVEDVNSTGVIGLGALGCAFGPHGRAVAACPQHGGEF